LLEPERGLAPQVPVPFRHLDFDEQQACLLAVQLVLAMEVTKIQGL